MTVYQSPPGSGRNDGALPQTYIPGWQGFDNLTPEQVVAFQSFPQDLLIYVGDRRWLASISGITVAGIPLNTRDMDQSKVSQLVQAFDKGVVTSVSFADAIGTFQTVNATQALAIYTGVVQFIQSLYNASANLAAGINAKTITTRKQVDAAYALIAPNSPSATNPSPT